MFNTSAGVGSLGEFPASTGSGLDELVSYRRKNLSNGTWSNYYVLHGGQDTSAKLINEDGGIVEQYEYDPYGKVTVYDAAGALVDLGPAGPSPSDGQASALGLPFLYKGLRLDAITGLIYMRNRFYSPGLGRFLSVDLFGVWHDRSSFGNGYVYASCNALLWGDPYGLQSYRLQLHYELASLGGLTAGHGFVRFIGPNGERKTYGLYSGKKGSSKSKPNASGSSGAKGNSSARCATGAQSSGGGSATGSRQSGARSSVGRGSTSPGVNERTDGYVSAKNDADSEGAYVFEAEISKDRYEELTEMLDGMVDKPFDYYLCGGNGDGKASESCATFTIWILRLATGLRYSGLEDCGANPWLFPGHLARKLDCVCTAKKKGIKPYADQPLEKVKG